MALFTVWQERSRKKHPRAPTKNERPTGKERSRVDGGPRETERDLAESGARKGRRGEIEQERRERREERRER